MSNFTNNPEEFEVSSILERVNCNICGRDDFLVLQESRYSQHAGLQEFVNFYKSSSEVKLLDQLVKCQGCSLVYSNPRVSSAVLLNGYRIAVDNVHHEQDRYRIRSFRRALKKIEKELKDQNVYPTAKRMLDVGCAGGPFPFVAKSMNYDILGLEPSKYLANVATKKYHIQVLPQTLEEFLPSSLKFDFVSFWDVLEHVPDPKETLNLAKSLISESGILILNLPMIDTIPARALRRRWPFFLNVHLFYFTRETICELLDQTGFEVIAMRRYWQTLSLDYVLARAGIHLPKPFSSILNLPFRYYLGQRTLIARKKL